MHRYLLGLLILLSATPARADVAACVDASERGQQARKAGKLREAREKFLICGAETCPALIKKDCAVWQSEIAGALPTVTFGAKDQSGKDLFDVTITMDGEVIAKKLDGKAVAIDPGPHEFKFEASGYPAVMQKALVKEGERMRVIEVKLGSEPTPPPPPKRSDDEHTIAPWVMVGLGGAAMVAGLIIVVTAPSLPSNCNGDTEKCTRTAGQTESDFNDSQDQAGRHDSQPLLGGIILAGGAVVVAGGLLWHFLEPTASKETGFRLTPWTTGQASGFTFGGRF